METLSYILLSTIVISLISLIGVFTLALSRRSLDKLLMAFVALSAGALIGGAFIHLIPEAIEQFSADFIFIYVLIGFVLFFIIEKVLHWRHCHDEHCAIHTFAYMSLFGDTVHNFIDGLIIAASYMTNVSVGIATTFAVVLHEIPQEIGDFGVLVFGGFRKTKALLVNFFTALTAVLGGLVGYLVIDYAKNIAGFLLPFAAGGFIYIAASDLIPELRKELDIKKALINFAIFIAGILLMFVVK